MKCTFKIILGLLILLTSQITISQNRVITGKLISQDLIEFPGVIIMTMESKVLDTTDFNGNFKFDYTKGLDKIKIVSVMMQTEEILLNENCSHLEIILLEEWIYDFVSLKRAERKKKRDRKKTIPILYKKAYEKKIFKNEKNCRQQLI